MRAGGGGRYGGGGGGTDATDGAQVGMTHPSQRGRRITKISALNSHRHISKTSNLNLPRLECDEANRKRGGSCMTRVKKSQDAGKAQQPQCKDFH